MPDNTINRSGGVPVDRELLAALRNRAGQGGKRAAGEKFSLPDDPDELRRKCAELNRQAVVPPPDTQAGKTVREILGRTL